MRVVLAVAALITCSLSACAELATAPRPVRSSPARLSFMNGPDSTLNVVRFDGGWGMGIKDPATGLWIRVNMGCAGEPYTEVAWQTAGELSGIFQALSKADVTIKLYRMDSYPQCSDTPLAMGFGRFISVDNDTLSSGTRTRTLGYHMVAPVTLSAGGRAEVVAAFRWIERDGVYTVIVRSIRLNGV